MFVRTVYKLQKLRWNLSYTMLILILLIASIIVISPIAYALATSLRIPSESFTLPPRWIPIPPDFSNYEAVFSTVPLGHYVVNSMFITLSIVVAQVATSALAGYAFARLNFPAKNLLFWLILATMMIPQQATIIPVFVEISKIGLADTRSALILPAVATAFGTFLMRQYFMRIPNEFEEAALIDGASHWRIFWSIYLPMVRPGLTVLAILSFNGYWNEFLRPLVFLKSIDKFTLPLGLVNLQGYMGTGSISVVLAGVIISLLPVLIIYILGQRYLVEGIMLGGLKA
ncbi:binding-protein-dependent transport systems inner membrane component [Thermobaculum terrenum ATCC BAA-798]|uniref:Binding-protein-dependent transport systems inner membrane component n=1 Tax=Thermobaculum terrenum (strain ATCC BAA-798 / CCMEE 7001 / YNP1) TaxID=525904 RepID=D1CHH9_THET1|nr:carbohydrate ABC transporter permease [Thermobaculum terrenum]ACZ43200.1 binding-protein-dependent transport systems inner membrane component [Thermobaculum terrenum ATCC BAA-798]